MSESFVAFRTLELRELALKLTGDEFKIYVLMATYADRHHARCWPGIPELMEQSGYGKGTVERARNSLERKGLVGCVARDRKDEFTGRQLPNVYEICGPLHLKKHATSEAEPFPKTGGSVPSVKHDSSITRINNQNQLTRINEPESVTTTTKPQPASRVLQKESAEADTVPTINDSTQPTKSKSEGQHQQTDKSAAQTQKPQGQKQKQEQEFRDSENNHKRDLSAYHLPLADIERERMAARIEAECGTTAPIAREMADSWGIGPLEAALSEMKTLAAEGKIKKSKYGVVKWHLETHAVAETDIVRARRRELLDSIRSGCTLRDKNTGETAEVLSRTDHKIQIVYEDGQTYYITTSDILDRYERIDTAGAGE